MTDYPNSFSFHLGYSASAQAHGSGAFLREHNCIISIMSSCIVVIISIIIIIITVIIHSSGGGDRWEAKLPEHQPGAGEQRNYGCRTVFSVERHNQRKRRELAQMAALVYFSVKITVRNRFASSLFKLFQPWSSNPQTRLQALLCFAMCLAVLTVRLS